MGSEKAVNHSRRAFLRGRFRSGVDEGAQYRTEKPWGPAPPWHHGLLKPSVCAGCDQPCAAACDQQIIRFYPETHGMAGLPYLSFKNGSCNWCGACADVCPMRVPRLEKRPVLGAAYLDVAKCLAWNGVVCMSCKWACSFQAIYTDNRSRPSINPVFCTGCGGCVPVCPEDAIVVRPLIDSKTSSLERGPV